MPAPGDPRPQIALAKFSSLRDEIAQRSAHQHTVINIAVTAVSTIAGFVLANKADPLLLLVVPFVSFALGALWYDHAINIDRIGRAKQAVEEEFGRFAPGDGATYESTVLDFEHAGVARRISPRVFPLGTAVCMLFVLAPVFALGLSARTIAARQGSPEIAYWVLWAGGVALTAGCLFIFVSWARHR